MKRTTMARDIRWFCDRVVCALDYQAGDPGSVPGSGGTTDLLFSAGLDWITVGLLEISCSIHTRLGLS